MIFPYHWHELITPYPAALPSLFNSIRKVSPTNADQHIGRTTTNGEWDFIIHRCSWIEHSSLCSEQCCSHCRTLTLADTYLTKQCLLSTLLKSSLWPRPTSFSKVHMTESWNLRSGWVSGVLTQLLGVIRSWS